MKDNTGRAEKRHSKPAARVRILIAVLFLPACLLLFLLLIRVYSAVSDYRADRTKTGVLKDGSLRIVYPYDMGGGYFDHFITDEGVIEKKENFGTGGATGKWGAVFSPVSEGEAEIYTVWLEIPSSDDYKAEIYHVSVDSGLNISYTTESISLERYRELTGRDYPKRREEKK